MPVYKYICRDLSEFEKIYRFVHGRFSFVCVRYLKDVIQPATLNDDGSWQLKPPIKAQGYQDILRDDDHRHLQIDGLIPDGSKYTILISTRKGWLHTHTDKRTLAIIEEIRSQHPDAFSDARKNLRRLIGLDD